MAACQQSQSAGPIYRPSTMDWGDTVNYIVWAVVALINGPIYYAVGLIFVAVSRLWKSN